MSRITVVIMYGGIDRFSSVAFGHMELSINQLRISAAQLVNASFLFHLGLLLRN